jgi:cell division protein ZapA
MAKTATRSIELEPIDRLEEKLKRLVGMVERMQGEQARAAEENQRLGRELEAMRGRLAASDSVSNELSALKEERDVIRARVGEMLDQVEIHGQRYPIRSALEPDYVARLASYVDEKIRAAADSTPTGDSLRLAVLAALNIADELFRCRDTTRQKDGQLAERAGELERLVDRVLMA